MSRLTKAITLEVPVSEINENFSENILNLAKIHYGETPLHVRLIDTDNNANLLLKSMSNKVDARLFVKALSKDGNFQYSIG